MGAPDAASPDRRHDLMEVYKTIFDTWRSQVDSYWQRSNYFAAFETAAIAGCLHLASGSRLLEAEASAGLCVLGIWLTAVWYLSNEKTHTYVRHWWNAIGKLEEQVGLAPNDFARQLELQRKGGCRYSRLIQQVPIVFGAAWVGLCVIAAVKIACHLGYQNWLCCH